MIKIGWYIIGSKSLRLAKEKKDDEFYTQYNDIKYELDNYKEVFKDKIVYLPCDDYRVSEFWRYFHSNFSEFGLKKLICSCYKSDGSIYAEYSWGTDSDMLDCNVKILNCDGSLDSYEVEAIMSTVDIIVTNPPFSLIRIFINILLRSNKKFIIWSHEASLCYKIIFDSILKRRLKVGFTQGATLKFKRPDNSIKPVNCITLTNIDIDTNLKDLICTERYDVNKYPKYYNYKGINIDKIKDIPIDYTGIMGVPITILLYNINDEFEILGISKLTEYKDRIKKHTDGVLYKLDTEFNIDYSYKATKDYVFVETTADKRGTKYINTLDNKLYTSKFHRVFIIRK